MEVQEKQHKQETEGVDAGEMHIVAAGEEGDHIVESIVIDLLLQVLRRNHLCLLLLMLSKALEKVGEDIEAGEEVGT